MEGSSEPSGQLDCNAASSRGWGTKAAHLGPPSQLDGPCSGRMVRSPAHQRQSQADLNLSQHLPSTLDTFNKSLEAQWASQELGSSTASNFEAGQHTWRYLSVYTWLGQWHRFLWPGPQAFPYSANRCQNQDDQRSWPDPATRRIQASAWPSPSPPALVSRKHPLGPNCLPPWLASPACHALVPNFTISGRQMVVC